MKKKIWIIVIAVVLLFVVVFALRGSKVEESEINLSESKINLTFAEDDDSYLKYKNSNKTLSAGNNEFVIHPEDLICSEREYPINETKGYTGSEKVFHWTEDSSSTLSFVIDDKDPSTNLEKKLYVIEIDYYSLVESIIDIEFGIQINGETPFFEASQINLTTLWRMDGEIKADRYGNDVNMAQAVERRWRTAYIQDSTRLEKEGLLFALAEGDTVSISKINGNVLIGNITVKPAETHVSYEEYLGNNTVVSTTATRYEAENMAYKSNTTINMSTSREVGVEPFSVKNLKLNIIGEGSWGSSGEFITWNVNVPEDGYYYLAFKVKQSTENTTSYRTLYVNGEIPFEEAKHLPFTYTKEWTNVPLQGVDGTQYAIKLNKGDNEITLEVDSTLYQNISEKLSSITAEMNAMGLNITKFTNGNTSSGIDWDIEENFPEMRGQIEGWIDEINLVIEEYRNITGFDATTTLSQDLGSAVQKLEKILDKIEELPRRLSLLSEGSSCAAQLVAGQMDSVLTQGLVIDSFYVYSDEADLPKATGNFFRSLWVEVQRFFISFFDESYRTDSSNNEELVVWVNRSRQYADVIQKLADDAGLKVKISLMSDDGKLILSNSADQQPDVALGVSAWIPNDYGMRGMLADLREFDGYLELLEEFNPEQLVPMTYDNHLYGLPETENFYVLFYRTDTLKELGLEAPNTWDDVIDMLPVLKRFDMDFYIPLSNATSSKSFDTTGPFIYQFGGEIYEYNAKGILTGGLENENTIKALEFITDLYTEYGLPYQVSSFFNEFRYNRIPIGIADFSTYLNLLNGAPEIQGLWDISVVPGVQSDKVDPETGEYIVNRYMPGAQQAGVIFEKSQRKDQAWEFLSWWMSSETQELYARTMVNTLGKRYLWNTGNMEAFKQLAWSEEHKEVIMEQWTHLKEISRIPGYYIVEREISNSWNKVVYNDENLRSTLSDAMIKITKEITRKMQEFGYVDSKGNPTEKPYIMPSTESINKWKEEIKDDTEE